MSGVAGICLTCETSQHRVNRVSTRGRRSLVAPLVLRRPFPPRASFVSTRCPALRCNSRGAGIAVRECGVTGGVDRTSAVAAGWLLLRTACARTAVEAMWGGELERNGRGTFRTTVVVAEGALAGSAALGRSHRSNRVHPVVSCKHEQDQLTLGHRTVDVHYRLGFKPQNQRDAVNFSRFLA